MKLPSVYANKIEKDLKNNTDYYHGDRSSKVKDLRELREKFDANGYVNRLPVVIKLKDGSNLYEKLVLKKSDSFVTLNNKRIYFEDIVDYEIKK